MVLMVRSFRSTVNILQWLCFSFFILLSTFAIYCVDSTPASSQEIILYHHQKRSAEGAETRLQTTQSKGHNKSRATSLQQDFPDVPSDLYPTNLVLVSTLDGSIRGIDRFQGDVHWTLKGGPSSSLIKSNSKFETHQLYKSGPDFSNSYESEEETDEEKLFDDDTFDDVITDADDSFEAMDDNIQLQESVWDQTDNDMNESEIYYIIEPQNGGTLYLYEDGQPLEKLPFTVKEIVDTSPFRTPDGTTYIGRKSTLMIEIDPRNGKILQQIDLNKVEDSSKYPLSRQHQFQTSKTILLGRNEYKVAIFDHRYRKLWNVTYSEYIPNKLEWDVPSTTIPTDIYIAPDAHKAITGVNMQDGHLMWTRELPYPVVDVFDVFRREDYTFAVSKQAPPKSLSKGPIGDMLSLVVRDRSDNNYTISTAYVGIHDGSLYALSNENYPLVQISQWSSMYTGRKPGDTSPLIEGSNSSRHDSLANDTSEKINGEKTSWTQKPHELCCHGCEYHTDCLIGQHVVQMLMGDDDIVNDEYRDLYLPPSASPGIALPSTSSNHLHAPSTVASPLPPSTIRQYRVEELEPYLINDSSLGATKDSFFNNGLGQFWKSYLLISSVIIYVYRERIMTFYKTKVVHNWKQIMKRRAKQKKNKARIAAVVKAEKEKIRRERADSITSVDNNQHVDHKTAIKDRSTNNVSTNVTEKITEKQKEKDEDKKSAGLLNHGSNAPKKMNEELEKQKQERSSENDTVVNLANRRLIAVKQKTGLDLENFKQAKSRVLEITDTVLGYGSHGTVVYKGVFDGRNVAVKRLLLDFYDVALQEVKLLQESDDHPNVVRYFYKEETDRFLYIALELCFGSLDDYMERSLPIPEMQLCDRMDPADILLQMTCGLQYLHSLKIVHRDIKPHNILLAPVKHRISKDKSQVRVLISDFGLCKKLDGEQSSFNYTAASPAGTSGWRAPELLAGALAATSSDTSLSSRSLRDLSSQQQLQDPNLMMGRVKATRAIDIFSAGCVFYYVLSNGDHPFGNRFGRENNILNGDYDLSKLDHMGEDGVEAKDLVTRMISSQPKLRPNCDTILSHPFFWSNAKKLAFLQDASDRFEIEERDPPSRLLQDLESNLDTVIFNDWYKRIDRVVANDLGKFRKYDGKKVRDLLRALRNKKHHWQDLPDPVKKVYGEPPNQFLYYFTTRFPHLLLHTYYVVANHPELKKEGSLGQYF
ncbi:hypothetical protein BDF20DRAFT_152288 [Mycotypha africana]|uniref:uncharacterized protein n=1 Tax=Mycotypha africana TaxID=64632 RepID=UPI0023010F1C|nr:uncharacterized protein BDF20DRAFT_152288 [Mycotypha africana]KAI8969235.1 hypothetical protein BDF20DRAFT_152288 [Mycotypha africana]